MIPPRQLSGGLLLLCLAILAASCGGVAKPEGWASPAVDDSTIYVFQEKDQLSALSLEQGGPARLRWIFPNEDDRDQKDIDFEPVYTAPVVDGDRVYFAAYDGELFALDRISGKQVWSRRDGIKGSIVGGPTLIGDRLAFGTTEGRLYVIQKEDGRTAPGWPRGGKDVGDGVWAAPVEKDGTLFVGTMDGHVYAFRLSDASAAWREPFKAGGAIPEIFLLNGEVLFVPSFDKHVYLLRVADGRPIHEGGFETAEWVWNRPAVKGDIVYFGDFAGKVYALDITTNKLSWPAPYGTGSKVKSGPVISGDTLVVVDRKPEVHFLAAADGKSISTTPIGDAGTVRADLADTDAGIFAVTKEGRLFRIDPERRGVSEITVAGEAQ